MKTNAVFSCNVRRRWVGRQGFLLRVLPAFAAVAPAVAEPIIGPQIRVDRGGTEPANETSIVASDRVPPEVVAAWNDYRAPDGIRIGVGYSADGGRTWTDSLVRPPLQNQTETEGDPMTAYDPRSDTFWVGGVAFDAPGGIFVARKLSGSSSFEPAVLAARSDYADKPWMTAGPAPGNPTQTRVYIAYSDGLLYSTDLGRTWSGPIYLGEGLGFLPRVGPAGELYVSYWDWVSGYGIMVRRSLNGGLTFGSPVRAATRLDVWGVDNSRFPGTFRVPPVVSSAVDPVNGNVYVVYFDTTSLQNGDYNVNVYFTRSTTGGQTWTAPRVINGDSSPPGDQFFSWIEVDRRRRIHVLFYDTRSLSYDDDATPCLINAYYAYSDDQGDTWRERRLTFVPFNSESAGWFEPPSFIGDYLGMAVAGNRAYPCYLSNQNGDSDIFAHVIEELSPTTADMNCDGAVNVSDLGPFALALVNPSAYAATYPGCSDTLADLNADGRNNGADAAAMVIRLTRP